MTATRALRSFYSQGFDSFLQKVVAAGFCEFIRTTSSASRHHLV